MTLGVDERRHGLRCRAPEPVNCQVTFHAAEDTVMEIGIAGLARNTHEVTVHGYTHVVIPEGNAWTYRFSREARVGIAKGAANARWSK